MKTSMGVLTNAYEIYMTEVPLHKNFGVCIGFFMIVQNDSKRRLRIAQEKHILDRFWLPSNL